MPQRPFEWFPVFPASFPPARRACTRRNLLRVSCRSHQTVHPQGVAHGPDPSVNQGGVPTSPPGSRSVLILEALFIDLLLMCCLVLSRLLMTNFLFGEKKKLEDLGDKRYFQVLEKDAETERSRDVFRIVVSLSFLPCLHEHFQLSFDFASFSFHHSAVRV